MSNLYESCINPNCIECPVMGREVCRELGIDVCDSYEEDEYEEGEEQVTPPHYDSVLRLTTTI